MRSAKSKNHSKDFFEAETACFVPDLRTKQAVFGFFN
jgi:hypothetical protein